MASLLCRTAGLLLYLLHAGDAYFYTAIRCQAGDQLSLALDAVALGTGDRIGFTATFDGNFASRQTFANQEVGYGTGTRFGEFQVVGIRTDTVGVTDDHGAAIFRLNINDLLIQRIQRCDTFWLEGGFAKGKQHVRAQGEVLVDQYRFGNRLRRRGGNRGNIRGTVRVHHQLQGRDAHVALPGFLLVTQIPQIAVACLHIDKVRELGSQAQTRQRRSAVVAVAIAVDVIEVGTAFSKHQKISPSGRRAIPERVAPWVLKSAPSTPALPA